ncbi:hypothetical protein MKS88_001531 [Plasmodium brasilianum]|uniref:Uncharacterized protein n=3 Tax=Plasmodium (Plasmodium) TaxID=418103 RepID=A0A1A8VRQ1_PLAMA|nr:hypothetical protein MKS88_001531 [Plasmodium brasilianum]SBS83145.1 hypothetical protein, conserved [Plasmodium malariae]
MGETLKVGMKKIEKRSCQSVNKIYNHHINVNEGNKDCKNSNNNIIFANGHKNNSIEEHNKNRKIANIRVNWVDYNNGRGGNDYASDNKKVSCIYKQAEMKAEKRDDKRGEKKENFISKIVGVEEKGKSKSITRMTTIMEPRGNTKDKMAINSNIVNNIKETSSEVPDGKNAFVKLNDKKIKNSKNLVNDKGQLLHISMKKDKTKMSVNNCNRKSFEKNGTNCSKTKNRENNENKKKNKNKKDLLNSLEINGIQIKNNKFILKFKDKLNKVHKYFFPIYKYGDETIARNKAILLKIHMYSCLYCQNGILCNFVENYTL